MKVREIMTKDVEVIREDSSLMQAASLMKRLDIGFIPVSNGKEIVGVLTDRDITLKAIVAGEECSRVEVREVMSRDVKWVSEDAPLSRAVGIMEEHQIRRLPVRDSEDNLVGVISLGDIAVKADLGKAAEALEMISEPAAPAR